MSNKIAVIANFAVIASFSADQMQNAGISERKVNEVRFNICCVEPYSLHMQNAVSIEVRLTW